MAALPTARPELPKGENKELLTAALALVSQRAPWIARTMYRVIVLSHNAGYMATDARGRIFVDFEVIHRDLDTDDKKAVRLATVLVMGLWRIVRLHDARGTMHGSGFAPTEWDQASVAVATRDAITTIARSRYATGLPGGVVPEPVITVERLVSEHGLDIDNPATCAVEDVFDALSSAALAKLADEIDWSDDE